MRIIGVFDYYFLCLVFIQFLVSIMDVKKLKKDKNFKNAAVSKWVSGGFLALAAVMTVVAYIFE